MVHGHRSRTVLKACHVGTRELAERHKKTECFSECEVTDESRRPALVLPGTIGGPCGHSEGRREKALGLIKGDLADIDISLFSCLHQKPFKDHVRLKWSLQMEPHRHVRADPPTHSQTLTQTVYSFFFSLLSVLTRTCSSSVRTQRVL